MSYRPLLHGTGPVLLPLAFLARLPYAMAPLATLMLLQSATGSYSFAGAAAGAQSIAIGAAGFAMGRLVERFGLRRVAALTAVLNAVAIVGLIGAAGHAGRIGMVLASVVAGLTQPQVGPLVRVHWAHRAGADPAGTALLTAALSYETAADEASFVLGPALVGLFAAAATPVAAAGPLAAGAVLLVLAALPLAALYAEASTLPGQDATAKPRLPPARLTAIFLAMALLGAIFGASQTGVTGYANQMQQPAVAGLLYAELGVGSALSGLAYARLPRRFGARARYRVFAAGLLAGMTVLAVGGVLLPLPVAIMVAGAAVAPYMISIYALTERLAPARVATAMTVVSAGGPIGTAGGHALAGALVDGHGHQAALLLTPALAGLAFLLAMCHSRRAS